MKAAVTFTRESALGSVARRVRLAQNLTQRELAEITGISRGEIDLFEHNLPVALNVKRRLLRELWARRAQVKIPA